LTVGPNQCFWATSPPLKAAGIHTCQYFIITQPKGDTDYCLMEERRLSWPRQCSEGVRLMQ